MTAAPALLLAAAGVGLGHAVMPDHWVPLAVVARTRRYSLGRLARLSGLAGVAHVTVSLLLGAVIVLVGLQFRSVVEHAQSLIVGLLLVGTGAAFALLELAGGRHRHLHPHHDPGAHVDPHHDDPAAHVHPHHDDPDAHVHPHHDPAAHVRPHHDDPDAHVHPHDDEPSAHLHPHADEHRSRAASLAAVMVPFGAAASPDLTILPVFLAATTAGAGAAIGSLVVFGVVTIATMVTLTLLAAAGGYQIKGAWLESWANSITAGVLVLIGSLVLAGVL